MKQCYLLRSFLTFILIWGIAAGNAVQGQSSHKKLQVGKTIDTSNPANASACPFEAYAGPDRYFCNQDPVTIQLFGAVQGPPSTFGAPKKYYWEGYTVPPNNATPVITIGQTTTFKFLVWSLDSSINLIQNPMFEEGNVAFTSEFKYSPGDLVPEERYDVLGKPINANPAFPPCVDHTTGTGLMLATSVTKTNKIIWAQSVAVEPNTEYYFSGWATRLLFKGALRLEINGQVQSFFPAGNCTWSNFNMVWNSGANAVANLSITQIGSTFGANAYGIDDLYFGPLCKSEDEMTVHLTSVDAVAAPAPSLHHCEDFEITLSGEGSTEGPNISYQWTTPDGNIVSGGNTLNPVVNAPGTYTLVVSNDDPNYTNCTASASTVVIQAPNQLSAFVASTSTLNCVQKQMTLLGGANPGGNYSYAWTTMDGNIVSGANAKNALINAAGTYTLLVTDVATGCTAVAEREVVADTIPPKAEANGNAINCIFSESILTGVGSSTGLGIYYNWSTPDGNIVSGQDSIVALADAAGTYVLKVTNASNLCAKTDTVVVALNNTPPTAEIAPADDVSCLVPLVVLSAAQDTSNPHLVYAWTASAGANIVSGENTPTPTVNAPGWYHLLLSDTLNGCSAADSIQVVADTEAIVAIANAPDALTCASQAVLLNANGSTNDPALTYLWTTADGNIVGGADTPTPTVDQPGTYQLWLSNPENGCTATDLAIVTENTVPPPVSIASAPAFTCALNQQVLQGQNATPSGSFAYQWTASNGGNILGGETTLQPEINAPGTYTLLATNQATGCTATVSAEVGQDVAIPEIDIAPPQSLTCAITTLVLQGTNASPSGSFSYQWTASDGGNILSGANTLEPEIDAAGTYTLAASNTANGCTATAETQVASDGEAPDAALTVSGLLDCHLTPVSLSNSSGTDPALLDHKWTAPDGGTTNTGTNPVLAAGMPGTYLLTLTNTQNGCTATAEATVGQDDPVEADLAAQSDARCHGASDGTLTVSAAGGDGAFTYLWDTGAETPVADNLPAGLYTVVVTDGSGCTATASGTVGQPDPVAPNATSTAPTNLGGSDGTATAAPSGGTAPYTFEWTGGSTDQTITGLSAGDYTVTVTDANGCTAEQTVSVFGGACDLSAQAASTDPACHGAPSGSATATPVGGTAPFTFLWSDGQTGQTATGLTAQEYTVVVTDANGCTVDANVTLTDPPLLSLDPGTVTDASCPGTPDGAAMVLPGGGTGNIIVAWSNGEQGPTASALPAGEHTAVATDENGCTAELTVTVQANDTEAPVLTGGPVTLPLGPAGVISLTLQNLGVTATDNCELAGEDIVPPNFDCLQLGVHTVTITAYDAAGNSGSLSIQVEIVDDLAPEVTCPANIVQCADNRTVQYLAPVATDNCLMLGGFFELLEGLPSGSQFPTGTTITTYTFTDASGNVGGCSFTVTILTPIAVAVDELAHDIGGQGIGKVLVSTSGSQPGYTYEWKRDGQTVATTEDLVGVGAGTYTLVVTDDKGCTTVAGPFVVDNLVGTDAPDWADLVAVYPNPTAGRVSVSLPDGALGSDLRFAVFDATGRLVLEQRAAPQKVTELDWSALADGLYTLLVRTERGQAAYKVVLDR